MKSSIKTVVSLLRGDSRYQKLSYTFDNRPIYNLPIQTLLDEIKKIHEIRNIRRLNSKSPDFADDILEANARDQADRSRIAEIMISCVEVERKLQNAVNLLKEHFLLEYSDHLRQFRTKDERNQVMNVSLKKYVKYIDNVKLVKEIALIIIADIDKAGYSISNNINLLTIHTRRERQIG